MQRRDSSNFSAFRSRLSIILIAVIFSFLAKHCRVHCYIIHSGSHSFTLYNLLLLLFFTVFAAWLWTACTSARMQCATWPQCIPWVSGHMLGPGQMLGPWHMYIFMTAGLKAELIGRYPGNYQLELPASYRSVRWPWTEWVWNFWFDFKKYPGLAWYIPSVWHICNQYYPAYTLINQLPTSTIQRILLSSSCRTAVISLYSPFLSIEVLLMIYSMRHLCQQEPEKIFRGYYSTWEDLISIPGLSSRLTIPSAKLTWLAVPAHTLAIKSCIGSLLPLIHP